MFIVAVLYTEVILVSTRKGAKKDGGMKVIPRHGIQATTRDALVAATFGFLQRGSEVAWGCFDCP